MREIQVVLGCVALLFTGQLVQADIVTANATIDLSTAVTGSVWSGFGHSLDNTVEVTSGDSVVINIGFLPGQSLTWDSSGRFNPWLLLDGYPTGPYEENQIGSFSSANASFTFLGLTEGTQFTESEIISTGNSPGLIHLGPIANGDSVLRTFTGVTVSFDATWLGPARQYSTIGFQNGPNNLFAGNVSFAQSPPDVDPPAVPEPASLILFGAGAVSLACMAVRRRVARSA